MTKLKLDWSARLALAGLLAIGMNTAVAADEPASCASAKIVSGDSCKDLKVKFDLSACKGGASVDGQVKCASGVGTVTAEGPGGTYTADLKETWGGTWAVSGPVRLTPPAAPVAAAAPASAPGAAAPAAAGMATPSGATVTFGGAARLRYDDNLGKVPTANTHTSYTSLRIRPTLNIKVNPDVSVFIEPQYAKTFGAVAWVPSAATGANTNIPAYSSANSPAAYTGDMDSITVNQAYLEFKMDYGLSLQAGRMALRYGDHLVLGSADWTDYGRSFDALKLRYTQDKSYIDFITSKVHENNKSTGTNGEDRDMTGVYASWNVNDTLKALEAYYLYIYDKRSAASTPDADAARPGTFFGVQGLRFVSAFGDIGWKGEWAQNLGSDGTEFIETGKKDKNDMYDTEVSYNLNDSMKSRIGLQHFRAGQNWREFYPTAAKQLGIVDVVGRRNLTGFALRYTGAFGERFGMDADWFMFKRTSTEATAYGISSLPTATVGTTAASSSDDIGQEIDLVARYMPSKSLTWSFGANFFMPGTYVKENQGTESGRVSHYGYIAADVKF